MQSLKLLAICLFLSNVLAAQIPKNQWGLTLGSIYSTVKTSEAPDAPNQSFNLKSHIGLQTGLFYRHAIKFVDIGFETNYQLKGFGQIVAGSTKTNRIGLSYLTFTPTIGLSLKNKFRLSAGLYGGYKLSSGTPQTDLAKKIEIGTTWQLSYITPQWAIRAGMHRTSGAFMTEFPTDKLTVSHAFRSFFLTFDKTLNFKR
jgi:hypothetical protein